jgi:hypothetical protein
MMAAASGFIAMIAAFIADKLSASRCESSKPKPTAVSTQALTAAFTAHTTSAEKAACFACGMEKESPRSIVERALPSTDARDLPSVDASTVVRGDPPAFGSFDASLIVEGRLARFDSGGARLESCGATVDRPGAFVAAAPVKGGFFVAGGIDRGWRWAKHETRKTCQVSSSETRVGGTVGFWP